MLIQLRVFHLLPHLMSSSALPFKDIYCSVGRLVKCHNLNLAFSLSRKIIW